MPFVDVTLADVKLDKPSPVPVGTYVFQLQPGAEYRTNPFNNIEELNVRFDVTDGDYAGRPNFVSYPDPTATTAKGKSMAWSAQALKKLEIALGVDSLPGEDPKTYLNRVATSGNNRITASIIDASYVKDGEKVEKTQFGVFTVSPAA